MQIDRNTFWKIVFWSVLGPVIVNILMFIPSFGLAATNTENWLGFFGNYSGGIVGGIVAYIIAKVQIDHEKEVRETEKREEENFASSLVEIFLYDELKRNLDKISDNIINALKEQSEGNQKSEYRWGKKTFEYEVYNEIKFELIKYNNRTIRETINVYKRLKQFEEVQKINDLSKYDALKYYEEFNKWKNRLDVHLDK
jgi:uncharacterized membrane protein YgaE (UPF0421/DUF939 family)